MLTVATRDALLASFAVQAQFMSLHTAPPGEAGAFEVAGGAIPYARQPAVWAPPAGGVLALSAPVPFNVPAGTVAFVGLWDALTGGNFLGWGPAGLSVAGQGYADAVTDSIQSVGHGLIPGDLVSLSVGPVTAFPGGLSPDVLYTVLAATADSFQVGLSALSAVADIGVSGDLVWQRVTPDTLSTDGTYTVTSLTVGLPA